MKNQNPITFLQEYLLSLKNNIEGQADGVQMIIKKEDIIALKESSAKLLSFCKELNNDEQFVQYSNALVNKDATQKGLYKAEHFFLSDIVVLIESKKELTEKQWFALAYYYDVLRNEKFVDETAINTLNRLAASPDFKQNVQKLLLGSKIAANQDGAQYFVVETLIDTKNAKLDEAKKHFENVCLNVLGSSPEIQTEIKKILDTQQPKQPVNTAISLPPENDTLEKVMAELETLIGLDDVKNDIKELINLLEIQKKRNQEGLQNIDIALHTVFLGPPGTGKTTVARLLSRIFKLLGFLSAGQLYETDREGLIAGYVGQTAIKTDKVVDESIGGVLFIDEAYSLNQNAMGSDYGAEAVNTILKRMEDNRDNLAVVVAGYTEPMQLFIESNPGLRSRFNRYFHFDHFKPKELYAIFEASCKRLDFVLTEDAIDKLQETFELLYEKKDEGFGNARVVRNLFEKCVQNQANRVIEIKVITRDVLRALTEEDIPEPKETVQDVFYFSKEE
ncbi:AAA family ATPase [Flavobacterium amniphilum]|uniref:AAA family ATPase n=1 Tax=Flavobacterium amniphilum TaxID=1834035 RepID=UPI00202A201C|nr:AAA family ATPase [Flavobacterium amniphilum]MCL9804065.1 AAA family ATPase [Flavobacterium amniphilum]